MEQSTTMRRVWAGWRWRKWLVPLGLGAAVLLLGLSLVIGILASVDAYMGREAEDVAADAGSGGLLTNMAFDAAVFHAAWDKGFGHGVLANQEQYTIAAAQNAGVNPALFAAIMANESGWGTSRAVRVDNNPSGQMSGNQVIHFSSIEAGIDGTAATLHNLVVVRGLSTLTALQQAYAPVGAGNDPGNLNSGWLSAVTSIIKQFMTPADADALLAGKGASNANVKIMGDKMSYFDQAYAAASAQLGKPYVFGANVSGANPAGFDCSGLVQWALRKAGISLPRTAQDQYDATKRLSKSEVKAGDLIFFEHTYSGPRITHVGIVLSSTQMINAAGSNVNIATYTSSYWQAHFAGFGRVK